MRSRSRSRERKRGRRSRSRSPAKSRKQKPDEFRRRDEKRDFRRHDNNDVSSDRVKREPRDDHRSRDDRKDGRRIAASGANATEIRVKSEDDGGRRKFGDDKSDMSAPNDEEDVQKPTFELSGKLMEDTNVFNGVVIKYSEPEEAKKPKKRWRFYVFKGDDQLPVLHLHRQSAYLIGKDRKIADIPVDHPSCSRQHAVLQYRCVGNRVLPYVIDLKSSNGTFLNNNKIDAQRYVELREKDVLKFGFSSREYVLLHENSQAGDD